MTLEHHDHTEWRDERLRVSSDHLGHQLQDVELYPKGSPRREQIAKEMSKVSFEMYMRFQENTIDTPNC